MIYSFHVRIHKEAQMKIIAICSPSDRRWNVVGFRLQGGVFLEIQRPGIPSVLREIRRRNGRRGRGMQKRIKYYPNFARGNQTVLSIALARESAFNVKAVLDELLA